MVERDEFQTNGVMILANMGMSRRTIKLRSWDLFIGSSYYGDQCSSQVVVQQQWSVCYIPYSSSQWSVYMPYSTGA